MPFPRKRAALSATGGAWPAFPPHPLETTQRPGARRHGRLIRPGALLPAAPGVFLAELRPRIWELGIHRGAKRTHFASLSAGDGRVLSTAYKRPQTMKNGHEWWKYVYDEFYNCVICPEYQPLKYSTTNRDGYREYKSDPNICAACPTRERCTHSRDCIKTVQRHIWKDYEELADDARYTPAYAQLYKCRKETIERVFADAKEKHAMRYTQYRGLAQVTNWVKLKFVAMNLKKLATWKWRDLLSSFHFAVFSLIYVRDPVCS